MNFDIDSGYSVDVKNSHYIRIHASEEINNLKITFLENHQNLKINKIIINKQVPLMINNIRLLLMLGIIFFITMIFSKTPIKNIKFNQSYMFVITFIIILSLFLVFAKMASFNTTIESSYQYKDLTLALTKKQFYLDIPVPEELNKLNNPYDPNARANINYYWDYAYFNGKYYSYFGIVPCLLTYLPFYLITNKMILNCQVGIIGIILFMMAGFYLVYQLCQKYFSNISYIWYVLLSLFYLAASGIFLFISYPSIYNIPVVYGLFFATLGLTFWLKSIDEDHFNKIYLFLGSLCASLVAGCRPQLLVIFFIAIPLFWNSVFKKRNLFSKKSIKETLSLVVPIFLVAAFIMYYNYARFGNIFDFGANYNLTTNDMTRRGIVFDRTFTGLFYYLFSPIRINLVFPFIEKFPIKTAYIGKTIYENFYGGFFAINIICLLSLFILKFKKLIKNKSLINFGITSLFMAVLIIIVDTQMAGILPRYIGDFGWLFAITTIIIILSIINNKNLDYKYGKYLKLLIVLSLAMNRLTYFAENLLLPYNPAFYHKLFYLFTFWF